MKPPNTVAVYHFETFDKLLGQYVRSRIRATAPAIQNCGGRILLDTMKEVPREDVSPSGFFIFGTDC